MSKGMTKREWLASTERATRERRPAGLRDAKRNFRRGLSPEQQMTLVEEVAETRAAELCRAYRNVVDVCFGLGEKTDPKTGKARPRPRPCVIFVVRKKWRTDQDEGPGEKLPEHLFAYWTIKGKRILCAVETDVEDAGEIAAVRPQASTKQICVKAKPPAKVTARGMIAAPLRRSSKPGKVFALGCHHVFSMSGAGLPPLATRGLPVLSGLTPAPMAKTTAVRGPLRAKPKVSFDAQLVEVLDANQLKAVLNGLNLVGYAKKRSDIPRRYWIIRSDGPVAATFNSFRTGLEIPYPHEGPVVHSLLVRSRTAKRMVSGNSGSPVVAGRNGGRFLGMHIAGKGTVSIMIPAWLLMLPGLYGVKTGESWRLL